MSSEYPFYIKLDGGLDPEQLPDGIEVVKVEKIALGWYRVYVKYEGLEHLQEIAEKLHKAGYRLAESGNYRIF